MSTVVLQRGAPSLTAEPGRVLRAHRWLIAVIFVGQVILSVLWLRFFRMGPIEWLWRSATYFRRQPLRRS